MKRVTLDVDGLRSALRTAGALMFGNAFVGFFVLGKQNLFMLLALGILGGITMVVNSLKRS